MSRLLAAAGVAVATLLLASCTQSGPDLAPQVEAIEQVGHDFRACEVKANSPDCRFAARDATKTTSEVWQAFKDAELLESEDAKSAFGIMEGWSKWQIRCDGEPNEYALWCLTNSPDEAQAKRAAKLLKTAAEV